jgi:GAF domain-containing protein
VLAAFTCETMGALGAPQREPERRVQDRGASLLSPLSQAEPGPDGTASGPAAIQDSHTRTGALLFATSDTTSHDSAKTLTELLRNVRCLLQMDIAFVSEFVKGRRLFKYVDAAAESASLVEAGQSHPLEETYCKRIVDGRLPHAIQDSALLPEADQLEATRTLRIAAYLSAPVVLRSGEIYGTLCCISHRPRTSLGPLEVDALRSVAALVARRLDQELSRS